MKSRIFGRLRLGWLPMIVVALVSAGGIGAPANAVTAEPPSPTVNKSAQPSKESKPIKLGEAGTMAWGGVEMQNSAYVGTPGGACLDADLNTWNNNPGFVQMWDCYLPIPSNQQWWQKLETGVPTTVQTPGYPHGPWHPKCLDATNVPFIHVRTWDCNGALNQGWTPHFVDDGGIAAYVYESQKFPGWCLQADGGHNGAPVNIHPCAFDEYIQRWRLFG